MSARTLLLTSWYMPDKILRWEDAVKMRYEGTVDVLAEYEETVSSPSVTWRIPAVVRARSKNGRSRVSVRFSKINVFARDRFRCQYCGDKHPVRQLTKDHVVPRSAGGLTTWTNIVTACRRCNARKDNKTCDEAGMWPFNPPRAPSTLPRTGPVIDREAAPVEWWPFLPETT